MRRVVTMTLCHTGFVDPYTHMWLTRRYVEALLPLACQGKDSRTLLQNLASMQAQANRLFASAIVLRDKKP